MARPVRIDFPGEMYHVMARSNLRANIVRDDEDRMTFPRTSIRLNWIGTRYTRDMKRDRIKLRASLLLLPPQYQ